MPHTFTYHQGRIKLHAISTGQVAVKQTFRESGFSGTLGVLRSFIDRRFTEWMPIWVWVIEHPEGVFVIDTGENARVNDPGYFKSSGRFEHWLNTTQFRFRVEREEEIDRQLEAVGLSCSQVDKVILTHLHLDHIDGLHHFPESEILVSRLEWEKPYGDLPKLYPDWLDPVLLDLDESYGPFDRAKYLTEARDLILLETPGHTYGHCSVLLETEKVHLFFAGDVVYTQDQLSRERYAAANVSPRAALQTYARVRELAAAGDVLVLPSHEEAVLERLAGGQVFLSK